MEPFTLIVLLLIAFLAWSQSIEWLFYIAMAGLVISSKNIPYSLFVVAVVGTLWFLKLQQYYFVGLVVIALVTLAIAAMQHKGGGEEYLSPELLRMLGGEH